MGSIVGGSGRCRDDPVDEDVEEDERGEEEAGDGMRVGFDWERTRIQQPAGDGGDEVNREREVDEERLDERVLVSHACELDRGTH